MTESKEPTTVDGEAPAAKPKRSRAVSLVDRVFDRLSEGIQKGDYPPDSKLPGEHELAAHPDGRGEHVERESDVIDGDRDHVHEVVM